MVIVVLCWNSNIETDSAAVDTYSCIIYLLIDNDICKLLIKT